MALVPGLGTTSVVVRHSPACAVLLAPGRCLLCIRGDHLWYAATTETGHNGHRIDRHVPQVVVAYHKLSRLVLMWWCGRPRRLTSPARPHRHHSLHQTARATGAAGLGSGTRSACYR